MSKLGPIHILYVMSMNKALRVTAIFGDHPEGDALANAYMKRSDDAVVATFGGVSLLASKYDRGATVEGHPPKPTAATEKLARNLLTRMREIDGAMTGGGHEIGREHYNLLWDAILDEIRAALPTEAADIIKEIMPA